MICTDASMNIPSGYVMSQWVPVVSPEMKSAALIQH